MVKGEPQFKKMEKQAGGGQVMEKVYCTAIVLAAGSGRRMGTDVHKQFLPLCGKPVLYYSLAAFEKSDLIDEMILVTGAGEESFCRKEIVEKYGFEKVKKIVPGGAERYHSVWNGLQETKDGIVYIHDGARPFVDEEMIRRAYECVEKSRACVAGMPVKDTIKIVDNEGTVKATPDRNTLWLVQTPQVFETALVKKAYADLMGRETINVTDDAMVVEQMTGCPVKMFRGSYENIKITTPEDLVTAEAFLQR